MDTNRYKDFIAVADNYKSSMTREVINETPCRWLDFYPHEMYVGFLSTLISAINGTSESVWLWGNYGTGKSNASLVTQKLFMDSEERVLEFFERCKNAIVDCESLKLNLLKRRREGTLVVYDYNAAGVGPNEDFLVRLEKGLLGTLESEGYEVPAKANFDAVIMRLHEEGAYFMAARNNMLHELTHLNQRFTNIDEVIAELQKPHAPGDVSIDFMREVQKVLHRRSIYLDISVPTFKKWIKEILKANNLKRIVYIFDEFHEFIESNKESLKTFEEVVENPSHSGFYLVPVTHMLIEAYFGESAINPQKSNDRFYFRNLQMPTDTAFKLARYAMKDIPEKKEEWDIEKKNLWEAVRGIVEYHFDSNEVRKESFRDILPIHPMAAFLLKFLSEAAGSNQRSIFEFLKGSADGHEFQDFITRGGPAIKNMQFLTVDYLWKYFMERQKPGEHKEIAPLRTEFARVVKRDFAKADEDDVNLRILKAVYLFSLLARTHNQEGHERLLPTVQNIELAFQGDGAVVGVKGIIKRLEEKHCLSVVDGNIELYASKLGGEELNEKIKENEPKFHELLSSKTANKLREQRLQRVFSAYSAGRFDVRVSDVTHAKHDNIKSTHEKFSAGLSKDNAAVCVWFVTAKNKDEQYQVHDKITKILEHLHDHRIIMVGFPNMTFCDYNTELWNEYVSQYAQLELESVDAAKDTRKKALDNIEKNWFSRLTGSDAGLKVYTCVEGRILSNDATWATLENIIKDYVGRTIPFCLDLLVSQPSVFATSSLKNWAYAGIVFDAAKIVGNYPQQKQLVLALSNAEPIKIEQSEDWCAKNPKHAFVAIRSFLDKKIEETVERGVSFSLSKSYVDLKRSPYGLKYNGLSAFALGFALSQILERGYQWDNAQKSESLDADTLTEIIESVVKDDGEGKISYEKCICRLTPQEIAFIEKGPRMFGASSEKKCTRVDEALLLVQTSIEKLSGKVPLWVLPDFIKQEGEVDAEKITEAILLVCSAGTKSSKSGKTQERTNEIRELGAIIQTMPELVDKIAGFVKPVNFQMAFRSYIERVAPELVLLGSELGDVSGCCDAVLNRVAETAGTLWKELDIQKEIDETVIEYEILKLLLPVIGSGKFLPYKQAMDILQSAVKSSLLPKSIILSHHPEMTFLLNSIFDGKKDEIKNGLALCAELVKALFIDKSGTNISAMLGQHITDITHEEISSIIGDLQASYFVDEYVFLSDVKNRVAAKKNESLVQKVKDYWQRLTKTSSPDEWAKAKCMPAIYAFDNPDMAQEIVQAAREPQKFSHEKLKQVLVDMESLQVLDEKMCCRNFLKVVVPLDYSNFLFEQSTLTDYVVEKHGNEPNNWPQKPDISGFLRMKYKEMLAPQVVEKLKKTSPESLKTKLLELAMNDPDVGMKFWERNDGTDA